MDQPPVIAPDLPAQKATTRIWPVILMVGVAMVIAVAAWWNLLRGLAELNALTDGRAQARSARLDLAGTLSQIKDIETGVRGFAISGRAEYLEPYHAARASLPAAYARTKARIGDNLPNGFDWSRLDELVELRQTLAAQAVDGRMRKGPGIMDERSLFDESKAVMDEIRGIVQLLDTHFQRDIQARDRAVKAARQRAEYINLGLFVAILGLLLFAIVFTLRERGQRLALEKQLRDTNLQLEARVVQRTADLVESEQRIAAFAVEQDRAVEQERRRVAREVHDQIGQVFTAIKLILQSVPRQVFPAAQAGALDQAIETGIATARRITADLRPPLLDDLGLAAALEHYADTAVKPTQLACEVVVHAHQRLGAAQALGLFRIVQEAINNILRHAHASRVTIEGWADGDHFRLRIRDNGAGFDPDRVRAGAHGLSGMRERTLLMHGRFDIATALLGGTVINIELPLEAPAHDEHPAA